MKRLVCGGIVGLLAFGGLVGLGQDPATQPTDPEAITSAFQIYASAFNKHDAKMAADCWTADCVYIDRDTGERIDGRKAMLADLEKTFKESNGVRIGAEIEQVRLIRPDVAAVDGRATVSRTDDEPSVSQFSAIMVKEKDKWLFSNIDERSLPQAATAREALRELEWLVGSWVDQSDEIDVKTTFRWSNGGNYLIRSYQIKASGGGESEGSQVIGWDPRSREIRSWTFNSDGSFGEATWSKDGSDWLVKAVQTLPDGRAATGTYVLTKLNENSFTAKLVAHEIEGEPQPAGKSVTVVRVPKDEKSSESAPAKDKK